MAGTAQLPPLVATELPEELLTPEEPALLFVDFEVAVEVAVEVEVVVPALPLFADLVEQAVKTPLEASAATAVTAVAVLTRRQDRSRSAAATRR